jgi:hypothetical protein
MSSQKELMQLGVYKIDQQDFAPNISTILGKSCAIYLVAVI